MPKKLYDKDAPMSFMVDRDENFNNEKKIAEYRRTNDPKIKEEIVLNNIPLVRSILKSIYFPSKSYLGDLLSDGYVALIEAIDRYELGSVKFSTFLTSVLRNKMIKAIGMYESDLSSERYGLFIQKYKQVATSIFGDTDAIYTIENIRFVLNEMLEDEMISKYAIPPVERILSCKSKTYTDEDIKEVYDDSYDDIEREEEIVFIRENFNELTKNLTEKQLEIIRYRLGFIDEKPHTYEDTGRYLGKSRQSVQQLEKIAMDTIKAKGKRLLKY